MRKLTLGKYFSTETRATASGIVQGKTFTASQILPMIYALENKIDLNVVFDQETISVQICTKEQRYRNESCSTRRPLGAQ